jgi:hypothetical protein
MSHVHEAILDIVDDHPNPAVSRVHVTGQCRRRGIPLDAVDDALADLQRDDSRAGQQLIAMRRDDHTWFCRADSESVAAANKWLQAGGLDA